MSDPVKHRLRGFFDAEARSVEHAAVRRRRSRLLGPARVLVTAAVCIAAVVIGLQLGGLRQHGAAPPDSTAEGPISPGPACAVAASGDVLVASFLSGEADIVRRVCRPRVSLDQGRTWRDVEVPWLADRGPSPEGVSAIGAHGGTFYLGTSYGRILRSERPAGAWEVVHDGGSVFHLVRGFAFGARIYAASRGLLVSEDGRTWSDRTAGLGAVTERGRYMGVGPAVTSEGVLLGISGNVPEVGVWTTSDEGRTWTRAEVRSEPLSLAASLNTVAVAVRRYPGHPAAWVSRDAGRTWTAADHSTRTVTAGGVIGSVAVAGTRIFAGTGDGVLELQPDLSWRVLDARPRDVRSMAVASERLLVAAANGLWSVRLGPSAAVIPEPSATPAPTATPTAAPGPPEHPPRVRYPARTAAEVIANITSDPSYQRFIAQSAVPGPLYDPRVARSTLGEPVFVRSLVPGRNDGWVVPLMHEGRPVTVLAVGVDPEGHGSVDGSRGWPHDTFPDILEAEARALGSVAGDAIATAELVWGNVPRRAAGGMLAPFWRLVRESGEELYLFQGRVLVRTAEVDVR